MKGEDEMGLTQERLRRFVARSAGGIPVRWVPDSSSGRAATRRRFVAVSVAAGVVACLGISWGVLGRSSDGPPTTAADPGPTVGAASTYPLPTSTWKPGDYAAQAGIAGTVGTDENGCLYLMGLDGTSETKEWTLWPAGFTATRVGQTVTISDPNAAVVARSGDRIVTGGSYWTELPPSLSSWDCPTGNREIAVIEYAIQVQK